MTQSATFQVDLEPGVAFYELKVAEVIEETADARSFVLEIPPDLSERFRYRAGQFLTFRIPWGDFRITRCYSLSSSPEADEPVKVTVKRVADGRMSNWFNDRLAAGSRIEVRPPAGQFVLGEGSAPLMFFGGGSGITPIVSLIKTALLTTQRRLKLLYANRDAESVIFRRELDALEARHPERLEVVHHLDDAAGFLTQARLHALIEGWDAAEFYVCGPTAYMDLVEEVLESRSVVFVERFISARDPDRREEPSDAPSPAGDLPQKYKVTIEDRTHEIPYLPGKTLLECAKQAGIDPPFSCEEGYCSCCMAMLRQGEVVMATNDALAEKDLAAGYVLTCQSRPTSPEIWVDYDG
ncbi:MAG: ferredoxin--NADP reductase [Proteobacteria bacterium]|nr:ferredoxin--NADP reductase [Pseudomonadota bacterium]